MAANQQNRQIHLIDGRQATALDSKRTKRIKTIILLSIIWFVVTLPLPMLISTPDEVRPQMYVMLQIVGLMSIPFIMLAIVWTIKPELTT
jgi:hypothetical protein